MLEVVLQAQIQDAKIAELHQVIFHMQNILGYLDFLQFPNQAMQ